LLESLTLNKFDIKDLITGDKNAILVASRVLGYGKDYSFTYDGNLNSLINLFCYKYIRKKEARKKCELFQ